MLRKMLWVLRQPRYAALAVGMFVLALICVAAGTWQISRFNQSVRENNLLRANAHAPIVPLTTALVPLANHGATPGRFAIEYRTVTISGTYVAGAPQYVRNQTSNGSNGYYALQRLRTSTGDLLVVRGFVVAADNGNPPPSIAAAPSGLVQITGRLAPAATTPDDLSELDNGQVESVNPADQAARLGTPVYDAYVTLTAGQPGTAGVQVLPNPDLTNPAGGAYEWQHFAYIVQWYLFALLALAAPFVIGRAEVREERRLLLGIGNEEFGAELDAPEDLAALPAGSSPDGVLAVRDSGTLARRGAPTDEQWQRAARLADRYGRSLGPGHAASLANREPDDGVPVTIPAGIPDVPALVIPNSSAQPHRSHDSFHGAYNDYLWELGLADGVVSASSAPSADEPVASLSRGVVDALPASDGEEPSES